MHVKSCMKVILSYVNGVKIQPHYKSLYVYKKLAVISRQFRYSVCYGIRPQMLFHSKTNILIQPLILSLNVKFLSIASQLFDPLGIVLPITAVAHLFIAQLWEEKLRWGQPLIPAKINVWKNIEQDFSAASCFQFLRRINFNSDEPVYLHVFTDASKLVIRAIAYISQDTKSILLGSKSKIAPWSKQSTTIPQFELSTILLGAQFCANALDILRKDFPDVHVCL